MRAAGLAGLEKSLWAAGLAGLEKSLRACGLGPSPFTSHNNM